jgi:hypothetical protein
MDKERLKELKCEYMALYQNGYIKLPLLDDLLALIDSALAEPSDVDVADAIEDFEKIKSNYMRTAKAFDGSRDPIYAESCKSIGRYDLAITALRQYQKPTDEAVQRAIEDLESGYHRAEMLDDDYIDLPISTETIALAITALRQMGSTDVSTDSTRATGCEWCDKILTLFTNSGKYIPENQPPRNYCPNCGRKLVK